MAGCFSEVVPDVIFVVVGSEGLVREGVWVMVVVCGFVLVVGNDFELLLLAGGQLITKVVLLIFFFH